MWLKIPLFARIRKIVVYPKMAEFTIAIIILS